MNKKINTYNSTRVDSNIYYFKIKIKIKQRTSHLMAEDMKNGNLLQKRKFEKQDGNEGSKLFTGMVDNSSQIGV